MALRNQRRSGIGESIYMRDCNEGNDEERGPFPMSDKNEIFCFPILYTQLRFRHSSKGGDSKV
jgi:hypothetical protein